MILGDVLAKTVIPAWMQQAVLERDGWKCLACGIPVHRHPDGKSRPDSAHMDHIIPDNATHRGLTEVDNLQTLCRTCNLAKGNRVMDYRPPAADRPDPRYERAKELFAAMHRRSRRSFGGDYVVSADAAWMHAELVEMGYTPALIKEGMDSHDALDPAPEHWFQQESARVSEWVAERAERRRLRRAAATTAHGENWGPPDPAHHRASAPGWFPDPLEQNGNGHRYWDGSQWTEHTAP